MGNKIRSPQKWKGDRCDDYSPRKARQIRREKKSSKLIKKNLFGKISYTAKKVVKWLIVFSFVSVGIGMVTLVFLITYYSKDLPNPDKLIKRNIAQTTKIFDRTGDHLLYEIHGDENRTMIKLEDIPDYAVNAVVALEDKDFYTKKFGLSLKRTFLAITMYGLNKITGHRAAFGGSGITQQLVKNAILSTEKTVSRKVKEWILTVQIEKKFSKKEILQMYFNEIPYGSTVYGIESASRYYFGKSAPDLEIEEAAVLAAIIQRPTYYSPYGSHKEKLLARKALVLNLMREQGYITLDQAQAANQKEIVFKRKIEKMEAPHFVFFVREFLTSYYGEKLVEQGGLKVITTLDFDMQQAAQEAIEQNMGKIEKYGGSNAALLAVDPKNGDILSMVGSRDYFDIEHDGNVNVVIRPRQPGSSFKPIVYASAFEKGYTPDTILYDVETVFKTDQGDYIPHNYDLEEHGPVKIRKALQGSLNIPAVKAIYLAGVGSVLDLADNLGYKTLKDRSRFGLSLVLGGGEVTLMDHVVAFTGFAQDGMRIEARSILEIQDQNGKVIDAFPTRRKRVLDKQIAREINNVLSDNEARAYVFGTQSKLMIPGRPVAAKTGTTNDYRDAWTIGYTPSLAAGVWVGNNDNRKMKKGAAGGVVAAPVWNMFMVTALQGKKIEEFVPPKEIKINKPVLNGELSDFRVLKIDSVSGKLATPLTPKKLVERKVFQVHHSILHYVYKDDPQGNIPDEPETADPEYLLWEEGIKNWINKKQEESQSGEGEKRAETKNVCRQATKDDEGVEEGTEICEDLEVLFKEPPIEYDDIHTLENKPVLDVLSPKQGQTIKKEEVFFQVDAYALRGVVKVEYFLNDELVGTSNNKPFALLISMLGKPKGVYVLKTEAFDDVGNKTEKIVKFNYFKGASVFGQNKQKVESISKDLAVIWLSPKQNSQYGLDGFPLNLELFILEYADVKRVSIYSRYSGFSKKLIGFIDNPKNTNILIPWKHIYNGGNYILTSEIQKKDGSVFESSSISVKVVE